MYSGVAPWSIANLWCNRKIHCHGFTRIDADLKSPKAACCKAYHASADPEEIASNEFVAKISTCKHRKCKERLLSSALLEIRRAGTPVLRQHSSVQTRKREGREATSVR